MSQTNNMQSSLSKGIDLFSENTNIFPDSKISLVNKINSFIQGTNKSFARVNIESPIYSMAEQIIQLRQVRYYLKIGYNHNLFKNEKDLSYYSSKLKSQITKCFLTLKQISSNNQNQSRQFQAAEVLFYLKPELFENAKTLSSLKPIQYPSIIGSRLYEYATQLIRENSLPEGLKLVWKRNNLQLGDFRGGGSAFIIGDKYKRILIGGCFIDNYAHLNKLNGYDAIFSLPGFNLKNINQDFFVDVINKVYNKLSISNLQIDLINFNEAIQYVSEISVSRNYVETIDLKSLERHISQLNNLLSSHINLFIATSHVVIPRLYKTNERWSTIWGTSVEVPRLKDLKPLSIGSQIKLEPINSRFIQSDEFLIHPREIHLRMDRRSINQYITS